MATKYSTEVNIENKTITAFFEKIASVFQIFFKKRNDPTIEQVIDSAFVHSDKVNKEIIRRNIVNQIEGFMYYKN